MLNERGETHGFVVMRTTEVLKGFLASSYINKIELTACGGLMITLFVQNLPFDNG